MSFDVFVSHNSKDVDVAAQLSARLKERAHLEPYFSPEEMRGGDAWLRALESAIETSRSMVVLIGRHGVGRWQEEEIAAALDRPKRDGSYRVIPVLLPGAEGSFSSLPPFLANRHAIDFRAGIDDIDAFDALVRSIRSSVEPWQIRRRKKLWYYDDNPERLQVFIDRHGSEFEITAFNNPIEVIEAACIACPGENWPDVVLVDMYAPIDSREAAAARIDADRMLLDFMKLERELKVYVDAAWRPYGADVVSIVRRTYSANELPIAIYTQRGLVLLQDTIISNLEWLGVQWAIKDRFSAETERLMFNNIIAEGKNRRRRGKPRILYLEDGARFHEQFRHRHSQHYDIEILSDQGEVLPALEGYEQGGQYWPDLLLVDLYYPNDTSEAGRPAIDVANLKLKEFHDFENGFRTLVKRAYEPLGLEIVEQLRTMHDRSQLPIIIYTQTALLLMEEEWIRRLEEYGTGWLLKDRYNRKTEEVKILAHILRSKNR